ncbi:MAG: hypothetical protein WB689_11910 [Xanthobacteraceae bacterium]
MNDAPEMGDANAESATVPAANTPSQDTGPRMVLGEEEISDVSLATFYVFDKENESELSQNLILAKGWRLRLRPRRRLRGPRRWLRLRPRQLPRLRWRVWNLLAMVAGLRPVDLRLLLAGKISADRRPGSSSK